MPNDTMTLNPSRAAKLAIEGKRATRAYGVEIVYTPIRKPTKISRRQINKAIVCGMVPQLQVWVGPALEKAIVSMPGLTHVDLWRDPETALNLYRTMAE